jgi:hypothetical protein
MTKILKNKNRKPKNDNQVSLRISKDINISESRQTGDKIQIYKGSGLQLDLDLDEEE